MLGMKLSKKTKRANGNAKSTPKAVITTKASVPLIALVDVLIQTYCLTPAEIDLRISSTSPALSGVAQSLGSFFVNALRSPSINAT